MSISTILQPQTPSTARPSHWLTLGVLIYAIAISVVLVVTSLSGHNAAKAAAVRTNSSQTAEGRAAADYVAPGLLATGTTDLTCRRTYLVRVC